MQHENSEYPANYTFPRLKSSPINLSREDLLALKNRSILVDFLSVEKPLYDKGNKCNVLDYIDSEGNHVISTDKNIKEIKPFKIKVRASSDDDFLEIMNREGNAVFLEPKNDLLEITHREGNTISCDPVHTKAKKVLIMLQSRIAAYPEIIPLEDIYEFTKADLITFLENKISVRESIIVQTVLPENEMEPFIPNDDETEGIRKPGLNLDHKTQKLREIKRKGFSILISYFGVKYYHGLWNKIIGYTGWNGKDQTFKDCLVFFNDDESRLKGENLKGGEISRPRVKEYTEDAIAFILDSKNENFLFETLKLDRKNKDKVLESMNSNIVYIKKNK